MSNILDSIQLSGSSYDLRDKLATTMVNVTQAEYDALVSGGTVDPTILYNITDAKAGDLTQYWTSAQTNSAITQAVSGKVDTSAITSSVTSASTDSQIPTAKAVYETLSGKSDTTAVTQSISEAVSGKADTSAVTAVQDSLSGYVTTNTEQEITSAKTFLWSDSNNKPIVFKQTADNVKLGFICRNSASTNNELATFEFRPDTYTDSSSVKHPLLYIGHYRNTNTANAGVVQTMVGFRQYDQSSAAAYHYLMPLPAEAKIPFSLTTSFKNYFAPLGFKNGSTMITADNTGVVDLSSEFSGKQDTLVSGTNIKTINNQSIVGSGNIEIQGSVTVDQTIISGSTNPVAGGAVYDALGDIETLLASI